MPYWFLCLDMIFVSYNVRLLENYVHRPSCIGCDDLIVGFDNLSWRTRATGAIARAQGLQRPMLALISLIFVSLFPFYTLLLF